MLHEYEQHPYGLIYPEMDAAEFETLCLDIKENGFVNPVVMLYEGKILDGWHRYQAALTLDRVDELTFKEFDGESPLAYIVSLNSHRRHLTPSQRAVIAVKHTEMLEVGDVATQKDARSDDRPQSNDEVAKVAGVGEKTVRRAKQALSVAPEKADAMIAGETTPTKVIEEHKRNYELIETPEFTEKVYDILYVDPPWDYKGQSQHAGTGEDLTGGADTHYPTMTLSQLKTLDIPSISAKNSLLFLWVTGPHLDQGIELGKAWGFDYKQVAFVWDKQRVNPGYYTMTQCEYVLVFKRGTRPGKPDAYPYQLVSAKRGEHSEKPLDVRERIFDMYPEAVRVELFARQTFSHWDAWGHEV